MGRFGRRAALRAVLSAALALLSLLPFRRHRSLLAGAAFGAIAAGAGQELPVAAVPALAAGVAGMVARRPRPAPFVAGAAIGVATSLLTRRAWPVAPRTAAEVRRSRTHVPSRPAPDGDGLTIVVNAAAGSPLRQPIGEEILERLPAATVLEVGEDDDFDAALATAGEADVLGIAGGDGSINAAAGVARRNDKPLFVIPAGTLNHFARDLGVFDIDDAVGALRSGDAVAIDTGTIDGRPFLNTASFGTYGDLVDARERLEGTIGKWPALVVALGTVLRRSAPMEVEIDGRRRRLWMVFVGNCTYSPPGFAPTWRERLDDGLLDVRLVDAGAPLARLRLLLAVLTGRLARTAVYEAFQARELEVRCLDGPLRLARDGETFDGRLAFTVSKGEPIAVYAPAPS